VSENGGLLDHKEEGLRTSRMLGTIHIMTKKNPRRHEFSKYVYSIPVYLYTNLIIYLFIISHVYTPTYIAVIIKISIIININEHL
jgi:hypothetical protein